MYRWATALRTHYPQESSQLFMSKIAIISQPDRGVLIDVGGCKTLQEATHHLTSTLQISSQFWDGMNVELNLGQLKLTPEELSQVMSIAAEVGVKPGQVF